MPYIFCSTCNTLKPAAHDKKVRKGNAMRGALISVLLTVNSKNRCAHADQSDSRGIFLSYFPIVCGWLNDGLTKEFYIS